jgi:hypothetical protein
MSRRRGCRAASPAQPAPHPPRTRSGRPARPRHQRIPARLRSHRRSPRPPRRGRHPHRPVPIQHRPRRRRRIRRENVPTRRHLGTRRCRRHQTRRSHARTAAQGHAQHEQSKSTSWDHGNSSAPPEARLPQRPNRRSRPGRHRGLGPESPVRTPRPLRSSPVPSALRSDPPRVATASPSPTRCLTLSLGSAGVIAPPDKTRSPQRDGWARPAHPVHSTQPRIPAQSISARPLRPTTSHYSGQTGKNRPRRVRSGTPHPAPARLSGPARTRPSARSAPAPIDP